MPKPGSAPSRKSDPDSPRAGSDPKSSDKLSKSTGHTDGSVSSPSDDKPRKDKKDKKADEAKKKEKKVKEPKEPKEKSKDKKKKFWDRHNALSNAIAKLTSKDKKKKDKDKEKSGETANPQ